MISDITKKEIEDFEAHLERLKTSVIQAKLLVSLLRIQLEANPQPHNIENALKLVGSLEALL